MRKEEFSFKVAITIIGVLTSTLTQIIFYYAVRVMNINYIYRMSIHATNSLIALIISYLISTWSLGYTICWAVGGVVFTVVELVDYVEGMLYGALYAVSAALIIYRLLKGG